MANKRQQLLVVHTDNAQNAALADQLVSLGYQVTVAGEAGQARSLLETQSYDLVLLDVRQGPDLLAQVRTEPATKSMVVATVDELDALATIVAEGADDYLLIPTHPFLLQRRIDAALQEQALVEKVQTDRRTVKELEKVANDLMRVILPLGAALSAEKNFDRLLERILLETKAICNADAGTLYLRTEDDRLAFAMMHTQSLGIAMGGTTGVEIPFAPLRLYDEATGKPNNQNVATYVALQRRSVNIPDVYSAEGFNFSGAKEFDRRNDYRSISNLTVPLVNYNDEVIGVLQLLNAQDPENGEVIPFSAYMQQVVESLASQAAIALNNQILLEREKKLVKFERDMEIARQIQSDFLPDTLLQPPGWEIAACFYPAREVAGDFYDVFPLPGNHVGIVIADVVDKGVPAALFMALIRSLMRAFSQEVSALHLNNISAGENTPTRRQMASLLANFNALNTVVLTNDYIISNHSHSNMFATMFFGILDAGSGMLTYVNGGHNPPVLVGAGDIKRRLTPTGPAVGMFPGTGFLIDQVQIEPGDFLLTFTDGVTEARAANGEFFTEAKLLPLLESEVSSAIELLDNIEARLRRHIGQAEQYDDITMLAVRRAPERVRQQRDVS